MTNPDWEYGEDGKVKRTQEQLDCYRLRLESYEKMATPVGITTLKLCGPEEPMMRMIDYRSSTHREWLARHVVWALNTEHTVISTPFYKTRPPVKKERS